MLFLLLLIIIKFKLKLFHSLVFCSEKDRANITNGTTKKRFDLLRVKIRFHSYYFSNLNNIKLFDKANTLYCYCFYFKLGFNKMNNKKKE